MYAVSVRISFTPGDLLAFGLERTFRQFHLLMCSQIKKCAITSHHILDWDTDIICSIEFLFSNPAKIEIHQPNRMCVCIQVCVYVCVCVCAQDELKWLRLRLFASVCQYFCQSHRMKITGALTWSQHTVQKINFRILPLDAWYWFPIKTDFLCVRNSQ